MKRFILVLSIFFAAIAVHAQGADQTPQQRAHIQAMHLQKLVSTNDDQTAKAEMIFLAKIKEINVINQDGTKTAEEKKTAVDAVKAEKDEELKGVLTPDQYTIYRHKMDEIAARQNAN